MIRASCNKFFLGVLIIFTWCGPVHASLIGDTVVARDATYYEPGYYDTPYGPMHIDGVVYDEHFDAIEIGPIIAGSSDATAVPPKYSVPIIDFEESGFSISTNRIAAYWAPNEVFNGFVIEDITPDPAARISGFTLTNEMYAYGNLIDFAEERITYTDDSIWLNFQGLTIDDGVITIDLEFTPVPIQAAVWLFGSGLIGLMGFSRRKKL